MKKTSFTVLILCLIMFVGCNDSMNHATTTTHASTSQTGVILPTTSNPANNTTNIPSTGESIDASEITVEPIEVTSEISTSLDETSLESTAGASTRETTLEAVTETKPVTSTETAEETTKLTTNDTTIETTHTTTTETTSKPTTESKTATAGQINAVQKAKEYLSVMAFSHDGLVSQLEYDQFTHEQAIFGADNCGANWKEQAALKAKDYLDVMSFSRDGLIEQLEYDEFTHEQAVYGVDNCGADWD